MGDSEVLGNGLGGKQLCEKSHHAIGRGLVDCAQALDQSSLVHRAELMRRWRGRQKNRHVRACGLEDD